MKQETKHAIDLAISALQRAKETRLRSELAHELDTTIRELGDVVFVEDLHPVMTGITVAVMPVLLQLKMMAHLIQLDTNPRGKKGLDGS